MKPSDQVTETDLNICLAMQVCLFAMAFPPRSNVLLETPAGCACTQSHEYALCQQRLDAFVAEHRDNTADES